MNSNFLRKGQAIDMSGPNIVNLGSPQGPMDAVRKKYVNERFLKRGDPVDMQNNLIKSMLPPTDKATQRISLTLIQKVFQNSGLKPIF